MFNQHAKWLEVSRRLPWRRPIASLNYLLSSHVWRQDHNGFSHQDPGFVDLVANKDADIVRIYFPPDANSLLWITDHCLRTYDRINVIVAGKQPGPQWLTMAEAEAHCAAGVGIWPWAGTEKAGPPDVVMACAGDVPTLETLAAVALLREAFPDLGIRVVNVVDLMALQPREQHPHGLSDKDFDRIFPSDTPVIFAYHGYPYMIHRLTYNRANHDNIHVHGFCEPPQRGFALAQSRSVSPRDSGSLWVTVAAFEDPIVRAPCRMGLERDALRQMSPATHCRQSDGTRT
jgi:xylulose-5-phosphate/fructose-6-phosphate phosphoketolase